MKKIEIGAAILAIVVVGSMPVWGNMNQIERANGVYWVYDTQYVDSVCIWDARRSASTNADDDDNVLTGVVVVPEKLGGLPVVELRASFFNSSNLRKASGIVLPSTVNDIGSLDSLMGGCCGLEEITVAAGNQAYSSRDGALYDKSGKTLILCPAKRKGEFVVPEGVEAVCSSAFECCASLKRIVLPSSVRKIGEDAFLGCRNLKDFHVVAANPLYSSKDGILYTGLAARTLLCCPGGREGCVTIPDGVEVIGKYAFAGCEKITRLTIPRSVREIRGTLGRPVSSASDGNLLVFCQGLEGLRAVHIDDLAAWCRISFEEGNPLRRAHNLYLNGELVTDMEIPGGVEAIGDEAFAGCHSLRSVVIPGSVTNIGCYAFTGCSDLDEVKIHEGVKSIAGEAFADCTSLHEIEIPGSVTNIGYHAFAGCQGLWKVKIHEGVKSIENGAFWGCSSLRRVVLPRSLDEISENLFANCTRLEEVEMPEGLKVIGAGAFSGCKELQGIDIPKGVKRIGKIEDMDYFDCKGAFEGCERLCEVEIPDGVETIGARTFAGCEELESVKMSSGVKEIGANVFEGCPKLKFGAKSIPGFIMQGGIVVKRTAPLGETLDLTGAKGIADDAIGGRPFEPLIEELSKVDPELEKLRHIIFPDGMTILNLAAFENCANVRELTIPPSVAKILDRRTMGSEWKHFERVNIRDVAAWSRIDFDVGLASPCCSPEETFVAGASNPLGLGAELRLDGKRVTDIVIPGTVERIGKGAYVGYKHLKSVVIEDGVKEIGDFAFYNCSNLVSLVIANSVTNIGDRAFAGCVGLEDITIPDSLRDSLRSHLPHLENPFVRIGKYRWSYYHYGTNAVILGVFPAKGDIAIPSTITNGAATYRVTGVGHEAFKDCRELTSVKIPDSIADVGTTLHTWPSNESRAFSGCDGLADKDGFIIVGDVLFDYKGKGGEVTIPNGVKRIGCWAFSGCKTLTRVTMPDSVKSIGTCAFQSCSGLVDMKIGRGVTHIGSDAFCHCDGLKSVTLGEQVANIEHYAFRDIKGLTHLTIPSSVTNIEWGAFEGCSGLKSVTIPACVTNVGSDAFSECDGLVRDGFIIVGGVVYGYNGTGGDIVIPDGVTRIDNLGHRDRPLDTVFKSVRIPKSVVKISSFGCFGVRSLLVADDNPSYIVVSGLLLSKDKTTLVKASSGLVGTVTIPDEVVRIEDGAFADCCDLSEITIPRGTSTIGDYAFSGCSSLKRRDDTCQIGAYRLGDFQVLLQAEESNSSKRVLQP